MRSFTIPMHAEHGHRMTPGRRDPACRRPRRGLLAPAFPLRHWCGGYGAAAVVRRSRSGAAGVARLVRRAWRGDRGWRAAIVGRRVWCGGCGAAGAAGMVRRAWGGGLGPGTDIRPRQRLPASARMVGTGPDQASWRYPAPVGGMNAYPAARR